MQGRGASGSGTKSQSSAARELADVYVDTAAQAWLPFLPGFTFKAPLPRGAARAIITPG